MDQDEYRRLRDRAKRKPRPDGASLEQVRAVYEAQVPTEDRPAVLDAMTRAVLAAAEATGCWTVTVHRGLLRVTVGPRLVFDVLGGLVWLAVDGTVLSYDQLSQHAPAFVERGVFKGNDAGRWFGFVVPTSSVGSLPEAVWSAHSGAIDEFGAGRTGEPNGADAWSPAVVELLAEHRGAPMPTPDWITARRDPTDAVSIPKTRRDDRGPLAWYSTLEEGLAAFDASLHTEVAEKAEAQRAEIRAAWPAESWATMSLESYAQGTGVTSFCSFLEGRSPELGRLPAIHAGFHQIYRAKTGEWRYPKAYGSVEEAWAALRAGYVSAIELAERGDYAGIDALPAFRAYRNTLNKALSVYFPDRFLAVASNDHLHHYGRRVFRSDWNKALWSLGFSELNSKVHDKLRSFPQLASSSPVALMWCLYGWDDARNRRAIAKIAPGEEAMLWESCLAEGNIQVGFNEVGDLRRFKTKPEYTKAFRAAYPEMTKSKQTEKANEIYALLELQPGSIILANNGTSEIVGVGEVQDSGYLWRPDLQYKQTLPVNWDSNISGPIPSQPYWSFRTIRVLPAERWDTVLGPLLGSQVEPRQTWIFQANPALYDLRGALDVLPQLDWTVSRYATELRLGDRVLLWESGKRSGVCAVSTIIGGVKVREDDPAEEPFALGRHGGEDRPSVRLRIDRVLDPHLPRELVKADPALQSLQIIKTPAGTNFKVTRGEEVALDSLMKAHGKTVTPPPEPPKPSVSFGEISAGLSNAGYYFPDELLADYLLALQAKRFVILTGISGTGKTQLAMQVADKFPLRRRLPTLPQGVVVVEVHQSLSDWKRFVIPVALLKSFPAIASREQKTLQVQTPRGSQELTISHAKTASQLLLKGAAFEWFTEDLSKGDSFLAEPIDFVDGAATGLRLTSTFERVRNADVIPVRPDWTDNRALLGYFNPLTRRYVSTRFLRLLLAAREEELAAAAADRPPAPFFAILDEMNLARVEHYFSDFLSALESGKELVLHDVKALEQGKKGHREAIPRRIFVPENLYFVGTVNVDETTYMFSPKVLDRAFTLELNHVDLRKTEAASTPLALDRFPGHLHPRNKPGPEHWDALVEGHAQADAVLSIHDLLAEENRHFGYRVANEVAAFVLLAVEQASHTDAGLVAMDLALLQKVLPKLSGTQQELSRLMDRLLAFAVGEAGPRGLKSWRFGRTKGWRKDKKPAAPRFPRTARKLWRMRDRLQKQGFASYVE